MLFRELVEEMRAEAMATALVNEKPVYSKTKTEAIAKAARLIQATGKLPPCSRHIILEGLPVSLVLTYEVEGSDAEWHLSMSKPGPMRVDRVPDDLASDLAAAFETPNEGGPEGVWENVRHFRGPANVS